MTAYYNEINPFAAEWLRQLIKAGLIAWGDVDERSIEDVVPTELAGYTQCHFFAGVGTWSYVLRQAGWPDDRPVWTGSCPCQPFSSTGRGEGFADERHLWPAWFHLVSQCGPGTIFGEQVASKLALAWLDLVQSDLEGTGYAVGTNDSCAAGFGAPHIRQRLYWVADAMSDGRQNESKKQRGSDTFYGKKSPSIQLGNSSDGVCGVADCHGGRSVGWDQRGEDDTPQLGVSSQCRPSSGVGNPQRPGPVNGFWGNADWLFCRDGKWRPVESGSFPLAHGAAARVGRLRGYGGGIVAPQAIAFVRAAMEIIGDGRGSSS